jgi:hypothetical protein
MPKNIHVHNYQKFFYYHCTSRLPNTTKIILYPTWFGNCRFRFRNNLLRMDMGLECTIPNWSQCSFGSHYQPYWKVDHYLTGKINAAMASMIAKNNTDNKTVCDYLKDLEDIKNRNPEQLTSANNVLIIVLTLISVQTCYCIYKICFTPSHNTDL